MNHLADLERCEPIEYQNIGAKPHPKFDSVVNRAHRDAADRGFYLVGTETRVDQVPNASNGNMACVWAKAKFQSLVEPGEFSFEGVADADPSNTSAGSTANALIRMAHTRALGRAISDALNIAEALAEEIAEGSAPAPGGNQGGGGQSSTSSGGAGGAGGNVPEWKLKIPMGRNKDKRIDDPTVDVSDLQWFLDNGKLNKKNPTTNAYDLPDEERIALYQNEIAKRSGQTPAGSAPAASPPPAAAQQQSNATGNTNWKPNPQQISAIVQLANSQSKNYAALKADCVSNFNKPDPTSLTKDEFSTLSIMLGGPEV